MREIVIPDVNLRPKWRHSLLGKKYKHILGKEPKVKQQWAVKAQETDIEA